MIIGSFAKMTCNLRHWTSRVTHTTWTGWRRCIGCSCRSFPAKEPLIIRLFSRKMTCKDKAFYVSSPPCINESCQTFERVMSHVWLSRVKGMNGSCHTYECVMYEWIMSHTWMSHVPCTSESCHIYEWVMSHVCMSHLWMRHVTRMKK